MPNRFKVLIVDDKGGNDDGWGRVLTHLQASKYLPEGDAPQMEPQDIDPLAWEIVGPDSGKPGETPFETACQIIEERYEEFVAFFLDLDLSDMGFLPKTTLQGQTYSSLARTDEDRASYLAGLDLLQLLPEDDRPKIFLTGSDKVRGLLRYFHYLKPRFGDVHIGDWFDRKYTEGEANTALEEALRKKQRRLVSRIPSGKRKELCDALRGDLSKNDAWDSLAASEVGVDKWTVGTLFPKQVIQQEAKGILALLAFDWRTLLQYLFKHPQNNDWPEAERGPLENWIETAEAEDFSLDARLRGVYQAVSAFNENEPNGGGQTRNLFTERGEVAEGLRGALLEYEAKWCSETEPETVRAFLKAKLGVDETKLKSGMKNLGLNPVDLAYICHIARHNGMRYCRADPKAEWTQREENGAVTLTLIWTWDNVDNSLHSLDSAQNKMASEVKRDARCLQDEGLGDVLRIVCGRYRGSFWFATKEGTIEAMPRESGDPFSVARTEERTTDNRIEYGVFLTSGGMDEGCHARDRGCGRHT